MAETVLAVAVLVAIGFLGVDNWRLRTTIHAYCKSAEESIRVCQIQQRRADTLEAEKEMLLGQKANWVASSAESPFRDRDKIPATGSRRFEPLAVRRARAEAESLGPQTHDAKVRENNARAMEMS